MKELNDTKFSVNSAGEKFPIPEQNEYAKEFERLKEMSRDQMSNLEYDYMVMKENTSDIGQIVVDFYKLVFGV